MWDLGSLAASLATTGLIEDIDSLALADRYGANGPEKDRLRSHFELCLAQYACWTSAHGTGWEKQHQAAMCELRKIYSQAESPRR